MTVYKCSGFRLPHVVEKYPPKDAGVRTIIHRLKRQHGMGEGISLGMVLLRLRDADSLHHLRKTLAVLRKVDALRRCTEYPDSGSLKLGGDVQRRLPAELNDHALGLFFAVDAEHVLDGQRLARKLSDRRDQVEFLLERAAGPVLQNSTRGDALIPNARRYGAFLADWGAIYERFGVPAEIGLAQVILESGLNPTRRSEANAIGFCQWLQKNWKRLNYFSPTPIEGRNQTTQAPYCAAYLSVLATKYGSFIPALSEHNAGGTNVGRTLINGAHLGAHAVS